MDTLGPLHSSAFHKFLILSHIPLQFSFKKKYKTHPPCNRNIRSVHHTLAHTYIHTHKKRSNIIRLKIKRCYRKYSLCACLWCGSAACTSYISIFFFFKLEWRWVEATMTRAQVHPSAYLLYGRKYLHDTE